MSTDRLRELGMLKDQEIRAARKAGLQEREGYLNMMHAVFNKMNEHLTTTVGALSHQNRGLSDLTNLLWLGHVRSSEAANKRRELEALINASSGPPLPGGQVLGGDRGRSRLIGPEIVAEIPATNPQDDAAMDRAVVIAPAKRVRSLDAMKQDIQDTAAKILKITTPELIPEDVPGPGTRRFVPSFLQKQNRATPYPSERPRTDRSLPPVLPPLTPVPEHIPLPTNGPLNKENYSELAAQVKARSSSPTPYPVPARSA